MADESTQKTQTETATIKVETKKGRRKPHIRVLADSEDILEDQVHGFVGFLREKAVVGLAVAFVVATQVQGVVKQLIASFLDPITTLLFGSKLSAWMFTLHYHGRSAKFAWGQFAYALIDFFVVVITIYAIIKLFKLDKLDKPKSS